MSCLENVNVYIIFEPYFQLNWLHVQVNHEWPVCNIEPKFFNTTLKMKLIQLLSPQKLVIGEGSLSRFFEDFKCSGYQRLFILSIPVIKPILEPYLAMLEEAGVSFLLNEQIAAEPSFTEVEQILEQAREFGADAVAGIGGGSVLDAAKFVAAQIKNTQSTTEVIGIGNLKERQTYLVCLPTTAGTVREVSPNALFLDLSDNE